MTGDIQIFESETWLDVADRNLPERIHEKLDPKLAACGLDEVGFFRAKTAYGEALDNAGKCGRPGSQVITKFIWLRRGDNNLIILSILNLLSPGTQLDFPREEELRPIDADPSDPHGRGLSVLRHCSDAVQLEWVDGIYVEVTLVWIIK